MSDFGTLDAAAVGIHEMYLAYVRAGFSPDQALTLVSVALAEITKRAEAIPNADT